MACHAETSRTPIARLSRLAMDRGVLDLPGGLAVASYTPGPLQMSPSKITGELSSQTPRTITSAAPLDWNRKRIQFPAVSLTRRELCGSLASPTDTIRWHQPNSLGHFV